MADEKTAWGYVRVSQESDASIDEQMESIRVYAHDTGLELLTTRNDGTETSGFDNDRRGYQLLRRKIEEEAMGAVVTRDRARLSRDFDERLSLISLFRDVDVQWHVIEAGGRIDMNDVQSAMFECMHAGWDHYKKMVEIERSRKAVEKRQEKGYYQGAVPYGFQFDDEKKFLEPVPDEFETCLDVIDDRVNGLSYRKIAEKYTDVSKHMAMGIIDRREMYEEEYDND